MFEMMKRLDAVAALSNAATGLSYMHREGEHC